MEENKPNDILEKVTLSDRKFIKRILNNIGLTYSEKIEIISKELNLTQVETEEVIQELGLSLHTSQFAKAKTKILAPSKRYIISSAQNASTVHLDFLNNIKAYANFINAEIGIIATRYKNPTSIFKEERQDVWSTELEDYLIASRQKLHNNVMILGDLKIQATSPNPTSGIELFGDGASLIVGAPKIEMVSVPVLPSDTQKFLHSTGSVTLPNFTESVAGGKAAEHHSFGFVIVEIENEEIVHIRNVSASDDGSFNDLKFRVEQGKVTEESVEGFVWGDSHFAQKDEYVTEAFRKICSDLGIEISVLHDVWDSKSLNIHNLNNPIKQYHLIDEGAELLREELDLLFDELDWFAHNMTKTYVISSNHDDMLDRALEQYPDLWARNLVNAKTILNLLARKLDMNPSNGVIADLINETYDNNVDNIKALNLNESLFINDIELGLHGHKGPNGSRGNIKTFAKLPFKNITGHSHSPGICGGAYQVGVSCSLDHGYNKGLSSWAYAGCTFNQHGKRQIIVLNKENLNYTTLY